MPFSGKTDGSHNQQASERPIIGILALALACLFTFASCSPVGGPTAANAAGGDRLDRFPRLKERFEQRREELRERRGGLLGQQSAPQTSNGTEGRVVRGVEAGGMSRTYIAHFPPNMASRQSTRVLIAFHPALGDGAFMEDATQLHREPGAENFIVVYPEGVRRTWNVGSCCGLAEKMNVNDLAFFDAIMSDLGKVAPIVSKAYITGYSNGSLMAYHLVCNRPEKVAAAVTFAAYLPPQTIQNCKPGTVPLMHLHGDSDEGAPVEGGMTNYLGQLPPARDTVAAIARRNRCDTGAVSTMSAPRIDTTCTAYRSCANSAETVQCTIPGLGHAWPGMAERGSGGRFGPARPELDGSGEVMSFFLRH